MDAGTNRLSITPMRGYKVKKADGSLEHAQTLEDARKIYCDERMCFHCRLFKFKQPNPFEAASCVACSRDELVKRFGDDLEIEKEDGE